MGTEIVKVQPEGKEPLYGILDNTTDNLYPTVYNTYQEAEASPALNR